MPNTYSQIYIQIVFAVEARQCLIRRERKEELQKYMTGIVTGQRQKLLAIKCMPDHTHMFIGQNPDIALSDLVGDIKTGSSNHINKNGSPAALVGRTALVRSPMGIRKFPPSFDTSKGRKNITRARPFATNTFCY